MAGQTALQLTGFDYGTRNDNACLVLHALNQTVRSDNSARRVSLLQLLHVNLSTIHAFHPRCVAGVTLRRFCNDVH